MNITLHWWMVTLAVFVVGLVIVVVLIILWLLGFVAFPVGATGAHKTTNHGTETARLMMWSNVDPSGFVIYPDSNKIGTWNAGERTRKTIGPDAEYYDGEI